VINVEIQVEGSPELRNRIVVYDAKMLTEQVKKGNTWAIAEQVISIIIMDKILLPEEKDYYNEYALCNRKTGRVFAELLAVNVLELPKLPKEADGTPLWCWGSFFKCETAEEFAMVAEEEPGVKKAVGVLMELSEDERNQMIQDARDRWLTDHQNAMNYQLRLGKEEGKTEGSQQKQLEIARNALSEGVSPETIQKITGLSLEKIAAL
jgi:predicted transposase/invertase (TIGR01784 family)